MNWLIIPLAVFVSFPILIQVLAWWRSRQSIGKAAPDTGVIDGGPRGDEPRVYYFYSDHCGPCRAISPLVDKLKETQRGLIKVNVAESPDLARSFRVAATPSFVRVVDGVIQQVKLGGLSEKQLLEMLE